jgi:hypothetical protein
VSHWSVASVATVKLITGAFDELNNDPTIGRAVALRRADMAMLDPKNPPEFAHPLSGRRSCSLAKVAREGKIDRSEMAIRGISAGGLRRSSLVRQTAGYGATSPLPRVPATVPSQSDLQTFTIVRRKPAVW